ncbi:hypothetical protein LSTR_LSTR005489 [Laodelphax striatellus]|uniref:Endonuclease/exonuclease/phosphatase domain-containing protein n=1 Tax=Laodelphax striatellus TaxID=195883 RepID=A0A482WXA3_LAOST|nr:hypothetical protein LSTR_LSTR005489 [Laodelphax striatellus]
MEVVQWEVCVGFSACQIWNPRGGLAYWLVFSLGVGECCIAYNGQYWGQNIVGEYTYIGPQGSSVIDICAVSIDALPLIKSFEVVPEIFSDHLPILTTILLPGGSEK